MAVVEKPGRKSRGFFVSKSVWTLPTAAAADTDVCMCWYVFRWQRWTYSSATSWIHAGQYATSRAI